MKKLNLHEVKERLDEMDLSIFTPHDIKLLFPVTERAINGFLSYNTANNKIIKLKKGVYAAKKYVSPFHIAGKLYRPSYISLETALSYYSLIPETVYAITSVTSKSSRAWEIQGIEYTYQKIKQEAYTGYVTKTIEEKQVFIAAPEKALADYCYFLYLRKKKIWNDRLRLDSIKIDELRRYLELFNKDMILFIKKFIPAL